MNENVRDAADAVLEGHYALTKARSDTALALTEWAGCGWWLIDSMDVARAMGVEHGDACAYNVHRHLSFLIEQVKHTCAACNETDEVLKDLRLTMPRTGFVPGCEDRWGQQQGSLFL